MISNVVGGTAISDIIINRAVTLTDYIAKTYGKNLLPLTFLGVGGFVVSA